MKRTVCGEFAATLIPVLSAQLGLQELCVSMKWGTGFGHLGKHKTYICIRNVDTPKHSFPGGKPWMLLSAMTRIGPNRTCEITAYFVTPYVLFLTTVSIWPYAGFGRPCMNRVSAVIHRIWTVNADGTPLHACSALQELQNDPWISSEQIRFLPYTQHAEIRCIYGAYTVLLSPIHATYRNTVYIQCIYGTVFSHTRNIQKYTVPFSPIHATYRTTVYIRYIRRKYRTWDSLIRFWPT
jgi:hypothetical protein